MSITDLLQQLRSGTLSLADARRAIGTGAADTGTAAPAPGTVQRPELEPIAIIGISGRYPGAPNLDRYWDMLAAGQDAVTEIPLSRWRVDDYYDPTLPRAGKMYAKWLGRLDDVEFFDPLFFSIAPGEAAFMDPQHRLFMQEAYKAFEDAGYAGALDETNCGVYFGVMSRDYGDLLTENPHLGASVTSGSAAIGAARLSYCLNLKGPAMPVDTACSSSLVATHLACQALRAREIDMALTGGSTLYLSPGTFVGMCSAGMLSPSGRCRTFDDAADGFVPGEGVGALVLKRLSDAQADGDVIHGVIVASGINQDGKTNGMTAPCKASQIELTRSIYRRHGIDPQSISYVEMHGTGTSLGDPIELSALATTFRDYTAQRNFCAIGSVKSNIGHTSAAAGVAGVHKVLLCMKHGMLVPTLHFGTPNRHFDFGRSPFYVNTVLRPWTRDGGQPRRAALSSFGFSGTNAHLVIEDYVPAAPRPAAAGPFVFVLSALDEDALRRYAAELLQFVRTQHGCSLDDLTYTLQVGRAQLEQRLALLVSDVTELLDGLDGYLSGAATPALRSGHADGGPLINALADRDDIAQVQLRWFRDEPQRLVDLWVKGLDVDWPALRRASPARRMSLPTYPFSQERYWLDFASLRVRVNRTALPTVTRRLWQQFSGAEFYLDGHRVGGQRVLPAAQCLEIARAAAATCFGDAAPDRCIELADVTWRRPIALGEDVDANRPFTLCVDFNDLGGGLWDFTLRREQTVYCTGRARLVDPVVETLVPADRGDEIAVADLYSVFALMGIDYGAANRGITRLVADDDEAHAWLAVPASAAGDDFALHPTMLDSALQATLGLALRASRAGTAGTSLPFALDALRIYGPTTARMTVRVRRAAAEGSLRKFDLDLADEQGQVRVSLRGFTSMPVKPANEGDPVAGPPLHLLAPVWQRVAETPAVAAPPAGAVLVIGASAAQFAAIAAAHPSARLVVSDAAFGSDGAAAITQAITDADGRIGQVFWFTPLPAGDDASTGVSLLFGLVKQVLAAGGGVRPLAWTVVTVNAHAVAAGDDATPAHAAVAGFVGAMAKEYPHWQVRLLDLQDTDAVSADTLARAPVGGGVCARRDGAWMEQFLAPVDVADGAWPELVASAAFPTAYRHGGVYVVIGGAGGLGEAWTEMMIRRYDAQVVWIGRRAEDDAIRARLDRLATLGRRPRYLAADAADLAGLTQARGAIGAPINGVIHSAIVLEDQSLANMSYEQFSSSLRAKIEVSLNLARVFADESLDFLLLFSSMQSFVRAAGQANYAAGCMFQDALARHLGRRLTCAVKTINWGYWGSVGIVATQQRRQAMASLGIGSIEADEGMAALELLLAAPVDQLAVVKATAEVVRQSCPTGQSISLLAPTGVADTPRAPVVADPRQDVAPREVQVALDAAMAQLLSVQLRRYGRRVGAATLAGIAGKIDPSHRGWLEESERVLAAHGLSVTAEADEAGLDADWEAGLAALRATPGTALVESTLTALPEILAGRVAATDVLFRDTSMDEVKGVYRGTVVADYYNSVLADALVAHVQRRRAAGASVRILEIGAGTGGTSALLFERLQPHREAIAEYRYTDLSRAFLLHAQEHYCADNPYIDCSLFDVEKPLSGQGIDLGAYDAVVATNVLHATRDIRATLRNAKAALRPGGVLLINEISCKSLFAHLTFGLLKGWWLAQDSGLRILGSPALAPETWARVLRGEGFEPVHFPAAAAHADGQQVIAAYSDGVVVQDAVPAGAGDEPEREPEPVESERSAPADEAAAGTSLRSRIAQLVAGVVGSVLKLDAGRINPRVRLERYGLDSILAVQMTAQLNAVIDDVASTLFIEYQTIDALVEHLLATRYDDLVRTFGADTPVEAEAASAPAPATAVREVASAAQQQAVAILGISGRFPTAASVDALWQRLAAGEDCLGDVPPSRWDHAAFFDADRSRLGKTYCRWGGFIDGVDEFDPLFFDFSPAAADFADPQVRLFLQTTWELIEKSGYTRDAIEARHDSRVGVFVGAMYQQYQTLEMDYIAHAGVSLSSYSAISNRVSNFFDFKGPSVAVDTQCSSALIAVHMARQSLVAGECELAVAGAVNLILSPKKYIGLSIPMMLGSHARCRSFADGDGFLPSEGVGAVLLKPLARAIADGDPILGVIRTTAQSHGGRGIGYGTQDPNAQYELISRCLDQSGVDVRSISYVEAAANGTRLSDAMEASALKRAFGERTRERGFCTIGSVKSNLGHCESASGVAQLAKVLMQLRHRQLPPSIHLEQPNPDVSFEGSAFRQQRSLAPWERPFVADDNGVPVEMPRRALIDCYGGGGSLAGALIEEYAPDLPSAISAGLAAPAAATRQATAAQLLILSARSEERLRDAAVRLRDHLRDGPAGALDDVAYTLQVGREAMESRLAFVATSAAEAVLALTRYLDGDRAGFATGTVDRYGSAASPIDAIDPATDLATLAQAWCEGREIAWPALHAGTGARIVELPTYPFERRRCWLPDGGESGYDDSLRKLDDSYQPRTVDGDGLPAAVHAEISIMLGLDVAELALDAVLARFELPQILLPRLRNHLQQRLGLVLDAKGLKACRTVQDVLNLIVPAAVDTPKPRRRRGGRATAAKAHD